MIHQNCFASIPLNSPQFEPAAIDESLSRPLRQPRRFDGSIAGPRHANVWQGPREQHQTRGDVRRNMGSQRPRRTLRKDSADRVSAHACPAHWTQAWPNTRRGLMPCADPMACAMTSAGDFLREACKLAETDSSGRAGDFVQASWHVQRPRLCSPQCGTGDASLQRTPVGFGQEANDINTSTPKLTFEKLYLEMGRHMA